MDCRFFSFNYKQGICKIIEHFKSETLAKVSALLDIICDQKLNIQRYHSVTTIALPYYKTMTILPKGIRLNTITFRGAVS